MYDLKRFFEHLQKNPIHASESDLRQVIYHYIIEHKLKPKTLVCVLAVVKEFYRFLYKKKMIHNDPSLAIEYPRLKSSKIIPVTQEQIKQIVDATTNDRDCLIVELFHYTGIRRSELIEIKVSDINFTKRLILIRGKGGKERFVPFNNKLQRMLRNYIDKNNIAERLIDLQTRHVNNIFQKISRRIRYKVHPHMLRHAYASELYRKTKDILLIKKLLGHSNVATTSRYLESLSALDEQDMESYRKVFG